MTKTLLTSEQRSDARMARYKQELEARLALEAKTETLTNMLGKYVRISLKTEYSYVTVDGTLNAASQDADHYVIDIKKVGTLNFVKFSIDAVTEATALKNGVNVIKLS